MSYDTPAQSSVVTIASESGTFNRIITDETFEKISGIFEGTYLAVTIRTIDNSDQLSPEQWVKANVPLTGYMPSNPMAATTVGGKPGVTFTSEGFGYEKTIVATSSDKSTIVLISYDENDNDSATLAENILSTLKIK